MNIQSYIQIVEYKNWYDLIKRNSMNI